MPCSSLAIQRVVSMAATMPSAIPDTQSVSAFLEHQPEHVASLSAEREPDTQVSRLPRNQEREHAIHADASQDEREGGHRGQQRRRRRRGCDRVGDYGGHRPHGAHDDILGTRREGSTDHGFELAGVERRACDERHLCGHTIIFLRAMARVRHVDRSLHVVGNGVRQVVSPHVGDDADDRPPLLLADEAHPAIDRALLFPEPARRRSVDNRHWRSVEVGSRKVPAGQDRNCHGLEIARRDYVQREERGRLRCRNDIAFDGQRSLRDGAGERQVLTRPDDSTPLALRIRSSSSW